ncbi:ScyD/ScyE family protein [Actinoplanes sp. TRM88002]|uniref:ScyD/ScyE family protein n=2 Tax=Paractinoplanes hotanensis TaxID=2906497 RepID=A0ABT0Y0Z8_9ACTN|nr:ScyD/ScyE family protein [Actinoplanes hotanensis]
MYMASLLVAALLGAPAGPPDPGVTAGPFDAAVDRRGRVYVTEGDTLVRLLPRGRRSTVASFPSRLVPAPERLPDGTPRGTPVRMRPVPTAVAQGPDGALYVGELTGYPFPPGRARVWRVVPGRPPEVYAGGFTAVTDLAWGPDGLYVLELAHDGLHSGDRVWALLLVTGPGRHRVVASARHTTPSGLTIHGRHAYVTACPDCPATARVRRISLSS